MESIVTIQGDRGSLVVYGCESVCLEFELYNAIEDPPCRGVMHVKSAEAQSPHVGEMQKGCQIRKLTNNKSRVPVSSPVPLKPRRVQTLTYVKALMPKILEIDVEIRNATWNGGQWKSSGQGYGLAAGMSCDRA
ncbi:hypothetical protein TNCV_3009451 [Trichonephila clavipes]|nr:hypothetical protein TNCV_3009451 [Trichonephila clavipes]